MLITPALLAALKTRMFSTFQSALTREADIFSERLGLLTDVPSDTAFNTYDWLASMSGMREWLGPRVVDNFRERAFVVYNKHYEKTVDINRNHLEDSWMTAVGDAALRMSVFTEAGRKLSDDLLQALILAGHSSPCYDGQNFFDTDHPTDLDNISGSQSNYEAAAFALSATNLQTAWERMSSFVGENGRPLNITPNLLVIPPRLKKTADDIITAQFGSSGSSNTQYRMVEVQVVAELQSNPTHWFLFDTKSVGVKPFVRQKRKPLQLVSRMREDDPNVFDRNTFTWGLDQRIGMGYGAWQKAFKGVG